MTKGERLREKWGSFVLPIVALAVLAADQFTKHVVATNLAVNQSWSPIPALSPVVRITHVTNTGVAFGLFPGVGSAMVVVAVVVVVGIVVYHRQLMGDAWLLRVSLGLQLGGAIGNLIDRLRQGYVVDFIDFRIWPVFNVADSALVIGVAILAYHLLREESRQGDVLREVREEE